MIDLEALRKLEKAATKGPWISDNRTGMDAIYSGKQRGCLDTGERFISVKHYDSDGHGGWQVDPTYECDYALIVAMRNQLPTLIQELEAAHAVIESVRHNIYGKCPVFAPEATTVEAIEAYDAIRKGEGGE